MWLLRKITLFLLILKKDFILQFRRPLISVVELCLPAVVILGLVLLRNFLPVFKVTEQCFTTFEADPLSVPFTGFYNIYYTPNNSNTSRIASIIQSRLPGSILNGTETEDEIIQLMIDTEYQEERERGCFYNGAAIVFNISNTDISYTLRLRHETPTLNPRHNRWFTNRRTPLADPSGPRVYDNPYFNEGFLHLEHVVGQSLLQYLTGSWPNLPALEMRQFPHKSFDEDQFLPNVEFILPLCLMVSFFISVGLFTKELVLEKESRLRESLKMNGLSNGMLWVTWFIKQFLFLLLPVVPVTILFKYGNIFPHSNFGTLLIFMIVYLLSLLSFSFFISVWFNNSQVGMMAAFVFWFLTVIPHLFYAEINSTTLKLLGCIFPNTCMGLGISTIALLELSGEGFQFIDFTRPLNSEDPINMHYVTGLLLLDCVLLMTVSWYMNEWRPGKYGIPKKFYFPFLASYWMGKKSQNCCTSRGSVCPNQHSRLEEDEDGRAEGSNDASSTHEEISDLEAGIDIKGLVKKFKAKEYSKTEITAVNNLYFKVYKGQITALLGHNGAGKTTTMSILTGLFPPNSGSAYIKGLSIVNDIDLIRRNLGICPQHNILFDRLTVSEHLYFFARLRGVPSDSIKEAVSSIISELQLETRKDYKANELSGGYKRKLCLAIALVGDPDILILDEPTSGMDHNSRLLTWQILEEKKIQNKTILISTHSLDDTEKATRLAIMVEGKLACSGSPAWLKKRYGVGYNLRIALNERASPTQVDELIKRHIQGSEPVTIGAETHCLLPLDKIGKFAELFTDLERLEQELGIVSFSIQENKMEDVFIKVGQGENKSWNTQVQLMSSMYSQSRLVPGHPPILPLSRSLNSVDMNTWVFQGTTPYSDGFSQSGASNYFPPPPFEGDDDDSWVLEEQDMSTTLDQPAGFPALDQSRISSSQLPIHRRSDARSPPIAGMEVLQEEEEEEEEEEEGEEMADGAIVVSIPVPPNRPRNKRLIELSGGERTPVPLMSRSRASSIGNVSTGSVIRPSILQDLNIPVEEVIEKEGGRTGIVRSFIRYLKGCLPQRSHACLAESVDVSKVTKICSNMSTHLLTRREAGKGRNGNPKRCSNEGSRKRREL